MQPGGVRRAPSGCITMHTLYEKFVFYTVLALACVFLVVQPVHADTIGATCSTGYQLASSPSTWQYSPAEVCSGQNGNGNSSAVFVAPMSCRMTWLNGSISFWAITCRDSITPACPSGYTLNPGTATCTTTPPPEPTCTAYPVGTVIDQIGGNGTMPTSACVDNCSATVGNGYTITSGGNSEWYATATSLGTYCATDNSWNSAGAQACPPGQWWHTATQSCSTVSSFSCPWNPGIPENDPACINPATQCVAPQVWNVLQQACVDPPPPEPTPATCPPGQVAIGTGTGSYCVNADDSCIASNTCSQPVDGTGQGTPGTGDGSGGGSGTGAGSPGGGSGSTGYAPPSPYTPAASGAGSTSGDMSAVIDSINGTGFSGTVPNEDAVRSAMSFDSSLIVEKIGGIEAQFHADEVNIPWWSWVPPLQYAACTSPTKVIFGHTITLNICPWVEMLRQLIGWVFAMLAMWSMYGLVFRRA